MHTSQKRFARGRGGYYPSNAELRALPKEINSLEGPGKPPGTLEERRTPATTTFVREVIREELEAYRRQLGKG